MMANVTCYKKKIRIKIFNQIGKRTNIRNWFNIVKYNREPLKTKFLIILRYIKKK